MISYSQCRFPVFVMVLAATVVLRKVPDAGVVARADENGKEKHSSLAQLRLFELTVLRPDGKVLPRVPVEARCDPAIKREQIREGEFLRGGTSGVFVKANAKGRVVLELPHDLMRFDFLIEMPGYAPYWGRWDSDFHPEPVPCTFTAELAAAWSVGGVIVDREGKPVEGAKITPRIMHKHRPGDFRGTYFGTAVKTDATGRWRFDSVPDSIAQLVVAIDHPDFVPREQALTRAEFGLDHGRGPTVQIRLKRGITVTGKVTDQGGEPIVGALVRTWLNSTIHRALSGLDGVYRLHGCKAGMSKIVVSSSGRAIDMKETRVDVGMPPVDFQMKPGGSIRIRVVDERGRPIPRARLLLQQWRDSIPLFEFDNFNRDADDRGIWEWHEAPLDEIRADVFCAGHKRLDMQSLIAREQEWPESDKERRWGEIHREVKATGTYTHTYEELAYGAQVAWRNAPKCVGRISWRNLIVRDLRHVTDPDEMFRECVEHLRMGINGGNLQIVLSAFRPKRPNERWGPRFWNGQYLR